MEWNGKKNQIGIPNIRQFSSDVKILRSDIIFKGDYKI